MTTDKKTIDIEVNGKVYVSKKINGSRKGLLLKNVFSKMSQGDSENQAGQMADILINHLPATMYQFIQDKDKESVGTLEDFTENVENDEEFLAWAIKKVTELNDFLAKGPAKVTK